MRSADRVGKTVRVSFEHAEGLHASGGARGFEIAGEDGIFHPASATLEATGVTLTSDAVPEPTAIRYGYQSVTDANLENRADLPAAAFALVVKE